MKRNYFLIAALIIAVTLVATLVIYPDLPRRVPVHWNFRGDIDRYADKKEVFLGPALMVGMLLLFAVLPWLSPKRFEVDTFRSTYLYIMLVVLVFMAYDQALMVRAALSAPLDMPRAVMGSLFLVLALLGNVLGKVRRNFYIGVRTPWTLASEKVWDATHRFAARVFVLAGVAGLLSLTVTTRPVTGLVIVAVAALASVGYSLVYYKRLEGRNQL
jgi:uncharacterized membrane protein